MKKIVIIGNGAAGNSAAETISRHNSDLTLLMVAREELPEYSACALPDYLSGWVNRKQLFIKKEEDYTRQGIQTLLGREVSNICAEQSLVVTDREQIEYDRLILATGSRAIIPPVTGSALPGNFVVKTIGDIEAIIKHRPKQAVVVGSGNIGIEIAEALHLRGCQATVIELKEHILPRIFDQQPAAFIQEMLTGQGIQVLTRETVLAVEGQERIDAVITDQRTINCDTVIWAAGVKPNIELPKKAGIRIGELGGIAVNSYMETTVENIYACGDCIESMDLLTGQPAMSMLWPNAKRQGEIAALNCLGKQVAYEGAVNLVVEDILGVPVVSMGWTSQSIQSPDLEIIEGKNYGQYWRVLVLNDVIMGMQAIGVTTGLGAIMSIMKSRITLSEYYHIMADSNLMRKAAWFLPARQFLDDYSNYRQGE